MKKRIGFQGFFIFLVIVAMFCFRGLVFPNWKGEFWDEITDILGMGLILFGFLFRVSSRGYKWQESSGGKKLIIEGPYALTRNPMYFGTFLIGLGIVLFLFRLWAGILFLFIFLLIYVPQIKREERVLLERFPKEYRDYSMSTPKFFPHLRKLLNIGEYVTIKLSWFRKELLSFILVVLVIIGVEVWQDVRFFGSQELIREPVELLLVLTFWLVVLYYVIIKK